ncbi:MAG: choice-of-anchor tandem repeat GloVer-containing protein [Candidatus Sulfotelmatobacter sp.]
MSPTGEFTNLHNVTDAEGYLDYDYNPLVLDSAGNIYGTDSGPGAYGSAYKLGTSGAFSQLYQFCSLKNCADGASPNAPIRDSAGNIYGTTAYGGIGGTQNSFTGNDVVFKVTPSGVETVLHEFAGGTTDGLNPSTRLKQDNKGNLYGITYSGGKHGAGVLFKVPEAGGSETILYNFCSSSKCKDGQHPSGQVCSRFGRKHLRNCCRHQPQLAGMGADYRRQGSRHIHLRRPERRWRTHDRLRRQPVWHLRNAEWLAVNLQTGGREIRPGQQTGLRFEPFRELAECLLVSSSCVSAPGNQGRDVLLPSRIRSINRPN